MYPGPGNAASSSGEALFPLREMERHSKTRVRRRHLEGLVKLVVLRCNRQEGNRCWESTRVQDWAAGIIKVVWGDG